MRQARPTVNIIGAGIGGLSLGAYLSARGVHVKVFEARDRVGGFVHSFKRGEYTFEATTHQISGFGEIDYMTRVFELLHIDHVPIHRLSGLYETCFLDSRGQVSDRYALSSDPAELVDELCRYFPDQREALEVYLGRIEQISIDLLRLKRLQREKITPSLIFDAVGALMLKKGRPGGLLRKLGIRHYPHLVTNIEKTRGDLLDDFDGTLRAVLTQHWFYIGTPPSEAPAVIASIILFLFLRGGGARIPGGTAQLVDGLAKTITDHGGEVHTGQPVRAILVDRGRARGVITDDGQQHLAHRTVSNISSQRTFFDMVGEHNLPPSYAREMSSLQISQSGFQVFIGAKLRLEDYGFSQGTIFFNGSTDTEENVRAGAAGPTPRSTFALVDYSADDASLAPDGCSSLVVFDYDDFSRWEGLEGEAYRKQKEQTQTLILEKLERATGAPIREKAEVLFSASPLTFQRYSSGMRGELFGPAATVEQSLMKRTAPETPIKDLYLVGAYTQPAHGISPLMDSGIVLGRRLVKELL